MTTNWNNPTNFPAGHVVTDTEWGTEVRDNLTSLNEFIGHPDGGHRSITDGGILLGNGTGTVQVLAVLAKGSLVVGDGVTDPQALAIGADGTYLTADAGETLGVKWATPAALSNPEDIMKFG